MNEAIIMTVINGALLLVIGLVIAAGIAIAKDAPHKVIMRFFAAALTIPTIMIILIIIIISKLI